MLSLLLCFAINVLTMADSRPKCPICGEEMYQGTTGQWFCPKGHGQVD